MIDRALFLPNRIELFFCRTIVRPTELCSAKTAERVRQMGHISAERSVRPNLRFGSVFAERVRGSVDHYCRGPQIIYTPRSYIVLLLRYGKTSPTSLSMSWASSGVINSLRLQGILLSTDGPYNNVIKIKPPLVFNKDNVDFVCSEIYKFLIHEDKK